jgi:MinD-like ATPase involved in chromosome partitioning or flagellar assembly
MTLRVATVLSAREWEARLVSAARATATVRLVLRAFLPSEVSDRADELDAVIVGSETPWATPARLSSWRRLGVRVVGIHPVGDRPAEARLRASHADLVLSDDLPVDTILREIRLLEPAADRTEVTADLIVVTGGRGGPGRTEVAIALAWSLSGRRPTILIDADLAAPGIAVRLGIRPRPDLADAVDAVHDEGVIPPQTLHRVGNLAVLPGAHRPGDPPLRPEPVFDAIDATRALGHPVVVDSGPWPDGGEIVKAATRAVIVVDATPLGVVRAAGVAAQWMGPPPHLVVNRVDRSRAGEIGDSVRRWTGLEPVAYLPRLRAVTAAARSAGSPARRLRVGLLPLLEEVS